MLDNIVYIGSVEHFLVIYRIKQLFIYSKCVKHLIDWIVM